MSVFYDRQGQPISADECERRIKDDDYRVLAHVVFGRMRAEGQILPRGCVSTLWIGLDHGFGLTSQPLIFETAVFVAGVLTEVYRYATEPAAYAGHVMHCVELEERLDQVSDKVQAARASGGGGVDGLSADATAATNDPSGKPGPGS